MFRICKIRHRKRLIYTLQLSFIMSILYFTGWWSPFPSDATLKVYTESQSDANITNVNLQAEAKVDFMNVTLLVKNSITSSSLYSTTPHPKTKTPTMPLTPRPTSRPVNTRKNYGRMNREEKEAFHEKVEEFMKEYPEKCEKEIVPSVLIGDNLPLCPCVPKGLSHEVVPISFAAPSWEELQTKYKSVLADGHWKPVHCQGRQKTAVIIPFRDRDSHLRILLQHMLPILMKQLLDFHIFVVEQIAPDVFNKGTMMNIGFTEVQKMSPAFDCIIFHDVDMMLELEVNMYHCDIHNPLHLVVSLDKFNYNLFYPKVAGGGLTFKPEMYKKINGYPNSFFGWGGEDDDMYHRMRSKNYSIYRYPLDIGRYQAIKHQRDKMNPANVHSARGWQYRPGSYKEDGLSNLKYTLVSSDDMGAYHRFRAQLDTSSMKFTSMEGVCPGGDLKTFDRINLEECAQQCESISECRGFVHYFWYRNCTIKKQMCAHPEYAVRTKLYYKDSNEAKAAVRPSLPEWSYDIAEGDCKGGDLKMHDMVLEECADLCHTTPLCVAFTWGRGTHCWIKNTVCEKPRKKEDFIFYIKRRKNEGHSAHNDRLLKHHTGKSPPVFSNFVMTSSDCRDRYIGTLQMTLTDCAEACVEMRKCSGFSFDKAKRTCKLVSGTCKPRYNDHSVDIVYYRKKQTGFVLR